LFVNLSGTALDKATLESMASGCIPVSTNTGFAEAVTPDGLERLIPEPGPAGLARTLDDILSLPPADRAALTARGRALVERDHGLERLADRLMDELEDLSSAPAAAAAAA
jgi:glycosyltransferase involved in cell wall biosynthesis